jgi:hypothetical protein
MTSALAHFPFAGAFFIPEQLARGDPKGLVRKCASPRGEKAEYDAVGVCIAYPAHSLTCPVRT